MNLIDKFHNWRRKLRWDRQYKSGRWDSLKSEPEKIRYQTITNHIKAFSGEKPKVLDLGSGEGIVLEYLNEQDYNFFFGMDFSQVSIAKARSKNLPKSTFQTSDIHSFIPNQTFDIILFNEIFYYIHETEREHVLQRMFKHLNDQGLFIVSIFREGIGCWETFDQNKQLKQLDFKTVQSSVPNKYWKVGVYQKMT